jgi:hypothetical protein
VPEPPPRSREGTLAAETRTFVLGNLEFVLLHELAHLVIGELRVPVLGSEEEAADYLAATALLVVTRDDPARAAQAPNLLLAAAEGLARSWELGQRAGAELPYWRLHALNIQRFYTLVCLLYGSDPEGFRQLPGQVGMPAERSAGCAAEWDKANRSFRWLLDNYGRKPGEAPGAPIAIRYGKAATLVSAELLEAVRADGLLERVAERVRERIVLPREISFVMESCGRTDAAWQPERRELVLCLELLDTFYRMSLSPP